MPTQATKPKTPKSPKRKVSETKSAGVSKTSETKSAGARKRSNESVKPKAEKTLGDKLHELSTEQWIVIIILGICCLPFIITIITVIISVFFAIFAIIFAMILIIAVMMLTPIGLVVTNGREVFGGEIPIYIWMFFIGVLLIIVPLGIGLIRLLIKVIVGTAKLIGRGISSLIDHLKGESK